MFAIGTIAERKVWTRSGKTTRIYPNLFIFLVGPPGTGKTQAIVPMADVLRRTDSVKFAPNDVSKQSLLDKIGEARKMEPMPGGSMLEYSYLTVVIRELANFMSQYDAALAGLLTDIFDNPAYNEEVKRHGNGSGMVINPSISVIAGTATKALGKVVGDLWGGGFMSRIMMVYSAHTPFVDIFASDDDEEGADTKPPAELIEGLRDIGRRKGQLRWTDEAKAAFTAWRLGGHKPEPKVSKLVEYITRRWLHVTKLSMISALSNDHDMVEESDFRRALSWLEGIEAAMPEIFKEMAIHSDGEVLRELHIWMWGQYGRHKQPIHAAQIYAFLSQRVASREIARIIEVAEASDLMARMAGTSGTSAQYKPKPVQDQRIFEE